MNNLNIKIGWLYPDLMSTYGDRGNITVLEKRCLWRGIDVDIKKISVDTDKSEISFCDLLFMGGAQDKQQEIVNKDLFSGKGELIKMAINNNIPALFICGAYQFMGKYYQTAEGNKLQGLGLFDLYTVSSRLNEKRLIGDIVINSNLKGQSSKLNLVGFENHGGRTYLGDNSQAFAKVEKGFGNNGEDKTEGIVYKNAIGTYLHGPILPKNPELADHLICKTLEIKYKSKIELQNLDDALERITKEKVIEKIVNS